MFKIVLFSKIKILHYLVTSYTRLFISDATSMYTNVDAAAALLVIFIHLKENAQAFLNFPFDALMDVLKLIMEKRTCLFLEIHSCTRLIIPQKELHCSSPIR